MLTDMVTLFSLKTCLMASVHYSALTQTAAHDRIRKEKNTKLHCIDLLLLAGIVALFSWKTCLLASVHYSALTQTAAHGRIRKEKKHQTALY
jgi:hypothetical protein